MIELKCPHCGHQLRIPEKYAGRKGGCKHCRGQFQVPLLEADAAPGIPEPPVPPSQPDAPEGAVAPAVLNAPEPVLPPDSPDPEAPLSTALDDLTDNPPPDPGDLSLDALSDKPGFRADPNEVDFEPGSVFAKKVPGFETYETLGCLFWGCAFFLPPVALVWALFGAEGHAQRTRGIVTSCLMMLVALISLAVAMGFQKLIADIGAIPLD